MSKRYRAIAEYYDAENARHVMLEHDVPFFLGQMPRKRQSVLELACGTGRAAIPIAQAGHRVVGVDYAVDMLAIARRKAQPVGLPKRDLAFMPADILKLDLGRRYDWVCIFFNTFLAFTTLAEQDQLLQVMARHLKPRGRVWIDIFQPDHATLAREVALDLDVAAFYVHEFDRTVFMRTEARRSARPQVQRVTFRYTWFDAQGEEHHQKTEFDLTYVFPRELEILLERNGLEVERLFGNYDGSRLTSQSPRIIARCCLK